MSSQGPASATIRESRTPGADTSVNRTTAYLTIAAEIWAFGLTPLAIALGFSLAGPIAAAQFRIVDLEADVFEGLIASFLILLSIQFWPVPGQHRRALSLLWLIRIGVTLGFMLPYEAYFGLDASSFFIAGTHVNDSFRWFMFGNGTLNVIGIVGVLAKITTSYSAIKVIFSYAGLIAVYILYRAVTLALQRENLAALYILGMFPSLLFWSSILGKDPITLLGIAIFSYGAVGLIIGRGLNMLVYVAVGMLIASFIRIWLGAVFLTPLLAAVVLGGRLSVTLKVGFLVLTVPLFLAALQGFADQFSLETTEDLVTRTDEISQSWARGGSAQQIKGGFSSLYEMILFIPIGAFTALFRPLPGEIMNVFGIMAGIENAFLLALIVNGVRRRGLAWLSQPLLLWSVLTLGAWSAVYGFASYQNLGTAFRFHVQVVPLLLMVGLYLSFFSGVRLPHRRQPFLRVASTDGASGGA